jgi:tetratricopeptide (TPR) repeat protein
MKFKLFLFCAALLILGLLAVIYTNLDKIDLGYGASKSPPSIAFVRCDELVKKIRNLNSCDQKYELFKSEFKDCKNFAAKAPTDIQIESSTFRDVIFDIAECYNSAGQNEKALDVYNRGLKFDDWTQDDTFNNYSAHFLIQRAQDLIKPSVNPLCYNQESFVKQIEKFANSGDPEELRKTLYSDNVLDTQVMASDSGGYLTYSQWKEVFEKDKFQLKVLRNLKGGCVVTTGWGVDYPWRGFCAEPLGEKNCYYLTTIYAGIEATLEDFVVMKTEAPDIEK